jgi:anhydro-N-acetylmuramic acid kinase
MQLPYFAKQPPKTAGREEFGAAYAAEFVRIGKARGLSAADIFATATRFTAESMRASYRVLSTQSNADSQRTTEVIPWRRRCVQRTSATDAGRACSAHNLTLEDLGIRSDAKEAMAFAVLAHEACHGTRLTMCRGATGASRP